MTKRLTSKHPDHQRFERACDAMRAEGVSINFLGNRTIVRIGDATYDLEDQEAGEDEPIDIVPPAFEFALVIGRD